MRRNFIALAVFVVVSLGLLGALAVQLGVFGGRGVTYTVRLDDAGGLVAGNAVKIAGVPVGTIASIRLQDNKAVLELRVNPEVALYGGDCVQPWPKSLLGEKFLQLDQGRSAGGARLQPGAEIECARRSIDIGDVTNLARSVIESDEDMYPLMVRMMKRLDALTSSLDGGVDVPGEEIKQVVSNMGRISNEVAALLENNRAEIDGAIKSGSALISDPRLPRMIGNMDAVAAKLRADVPGLLDRTERAVAELEKAAQRLGGVLDDRRVAELGAMIDDARATAANMRDLSADLKATGRDLGPIASYARQLLKRANEFSLADFIRVFQVEGFKTHIGVFGGRDAKKRLEEAEAAESDRKKRGE